MGSAFMDKIGDKEATVASGMIREVGSTDQGQRRGELVRLETLGASLSCNLPAPQPATALSPGRVPKDQPPSFAGGVLAAAKRKANGKKFALERVSTWGDHSPQDKVICL